MKKVGILYICTGEYSNFWDNFYQSCEKHFASECERHYFIFTDNTKFLDLKINRVHPIFQEQMKWPYPTLFRYKIFNQYREHFQDMDYLIFCNANLLFQDSISLYDLFKERYMFAVLHPGYYDKSIDKFPDETNQKSLAYIKRDNSSKYVCGGFNGGTLGKFLSMSKELSENIDEDLSNNIIAIWHDETHFNKYVELNKNIINMLDSGYCFPENTIHRLKMKIIVLDKDNIISIKHKGVLYILKYFIIKKIKYFKNKIVGGKK